MTTDAGPLYEVSIFVAPDAVADCERLLAAHREGVVTGSGILACHVLAGAEDDAGNLQRICLYALAGDAALDALIDAEAAELEAAVAEAFGDTATVTSRVLRQDDVADLGPVSTPNCLNCGQRLKGQYCAVCGQRSRSRLISLWELVTDAFGDLFELDSRLWQTLIPLMVRPGRLTHDYLQGRRARYMPPFRMYLVLSLLFFVVAFFDPRASLSIFFEDPGPPTAAEVAASDAERAGAQITIDGQQVDAGSNCEIDLSDADDMPAWLARRLTPERMQRVCERVKLDDGKSLLANVLDNIPAALIILLPIMAFVLKALYPLSKRYYVEHLLFFVHFHAFFFLLLTLQIVLVRIGNWLGIPDAIPILIVIGLSGYVAAYLYVAMRKVYGQGRVITFLKYLVLLVAYLVGFSLMLAGAFAIAAFSL